MTPRDALISNLERIRDAIDSERNQRGLIQMGVKRPRLLSKELEEADGHIRFILNEQIHALKITAAKRPKLSVQSHWALRHIAEMGSVGAFTSLSCHWSQQPDMTHVRGLIRRGWVREEMNGGIFVITSEGRAAAALVGPCPLPKQSPDQS
jgi:hypothetical protein